MHKDSADIELKHKRFLKEVLETGEVYTLKQKNGYVSSSSNNYEDDEGQPLLLQVFWSSEKEASVCSRHVWEGENFELDRIKLNDFLEFWCAGMHNDGTVVGTNFDFNLFGYEAVPLVLAKDILELARAQGVELNFTNYSSADEYLELIKSHI